MKISIIVPVYNSEKYLIECIESILSQSHRNIELLLVDDESQDTSPEICDMYQTNDERVKVVHKKMAERQKREMSACKWQQEIM